MSNLDDDGTKPTIDPDQYSVSPDRRWIAFGSTEFRHSPDDRKLGFVGGILWAVSVDGKRFKRLTPPITDQLDRTGSCADRSNCLNGETCDTATRKCTRNMLTAGYDHPVWSADGNMIFSQLTLSWVCPIGVTNLDYCWFARVQGLQTDSQQGWKAALGCRTNRPLALHPDGGSLLVYRRACINTQVQPNGIYELGGLGATDEPAEKRTIAKSTSSYVSGSTVISVNFQPEDAAWLPDGTLLLVASGATKKAVANYKGPVRSYRQGVYQWTESGEPKLIYEPPTDDSDVARIAVARTGQVVLEIVRNTGTGGDSSHLFSFYSKSGTLEQLTTSGNNVLGLDGERATATTGPVSAPRGRWVSLGRQPPTLTRRPPPRLPLR